MARVTLQDLELLRQLMQKTSFRHGDFTLSSGRTSHYYYDGKRTTLRPRSAQVIGRVILGMIEEAGAEAVGGLAIGADPIAQSVALASLETEREMPAFIVRKEQKEHGTKDRVAQAFAGDGDEPLLRPARRVAIVDDVITTGGSIETAITAVEDLGCKVVIVVALVERHEHGGDALRGRGYDFRRVFYTDEEGRVFIDDELRERLARSNSAGLVRG